MVHSVDAAADWSDDAVCYSVGCSSSWPRCVTGIECSFCRQCQSWSLYWHAEIFVYVLYDFYLVYRPSHFESVCEDDLLRIGLSRLDAQRLLAAVKQKLPSSTSSVIKVFTYCVFWVGISKDVRYPRCGNWELVSGGGGVLPRVFLICGFCCTSVWFLLIKENV